MPSVRNGNIDIHYEVTGQGMPFLFFSETACPGDIWNNFQVPEFSRDHRVITHDYRGTGKSSKPTTQYSCDDFVDDAAAILDHLNAGPAIAVGHSMGGRVAMLMALKYPAKVKKLIVASVGPGAPGAPPIPFKMCKEMAEWGYEKYVREHTLEVGWTREYIQQHPDKVEHFLNIRLNNLPRPGRLFASRRCPASLRSQRPNQGDPTSHARACRRARSRLCDRRVAPRCRRGASEGVTQWKVCRGTKRSAQLFHDQPG